MKNIVLAFLFIPVFVVGQTGHATRNAQKFQGRDTTAFVTQFDLTQPISITTLTVGTVSATTITGTATVTINKKVNLTGISQQDTAKKILGYNVGTGEIKAMQYIHGLMFIDSTTYTPAVSRYTYTKVKPGMTVGETDGITMRGDSIIILTAGDYYVHLGCAVSGANNNDWHIKMFVNGAKAVVPGGSCFFSTTGDPNYQPVSWFWYKASLAVGTYLDFRITNNTNTDDPTFRSMKVFIERKFE